MNNTTNPSNAAIDSLARAAADLAMKGAADYLAIKGQLRTCDVEALCAALRAQVPADLGRAIDDAREAFTAHMGALATTTFSAAMRLSGIKAAKRALGELPGPCECAQRDSGQCLSCQREGV